MNLDELQAQAEKDLKIDDTELDIESLNTENSDLNDDKEYRIFAEDIGPGNCLIDEWVRKNSKYRYDKDGLIAKSGKVNKLIFNQAVDNFLNLNIFKNKSLDIKDFDISFVRGLSLEDGAATLIHLSAKIIEEGLINFINKNSSIIHIRQDHSLFYRENMSKVETRLKYVKSFDGLIIQHPEEPSLSSEGVMNEGEISTRLGLKGIPNFAEPMIIVT